MKVLNLYCGVGGNRKLWTNVEVTAIENNPEIAKIYGNFFPNDSVIVTDAHEYLLKHYKEYDFIWSSPPCPTHSKIRNIAGLGKNGVEPVYPEMSLYQEIIFLQRVSQSKQLDWKGKWIVENVESYYKPLIRTQNISRHYFWSNFIINKEKFKGRTHCDVVGSKPCYDFDLTKIQTNLDKRLLLRNLVEPELGKYIFDCAFHTKQTKLNEAIQ